MDYVQESIKMVDGKIKLMYSMPVEDFEEIMISNLRACCQLDPDRLQKIVKETLNVDEYHKYLVATLRKLYRQWPETFRAIVKLAEEQPKGM